MEMTLCTWRLSLDRLSPTSHELTRWYDSSAAHWHRSLERLGYLSAYRSLLAQLQADGLLRQLPPQAHILDAGIGTGGPFTKHRIFSLFV